SGNAALQTRLLHQGLIVIRGANLIRAPHGDSRLHGESPFQRGGQVQILSRLRPETKQADFLFLSQPTDRMAFEEMALSCGSGRCLDESSKSVSILSAI